MCLAIPALITQLCGDDHARVDMGGVSREISLALLEDCSVGDWVIVHVGYALRKLDAVEAEKTLQLMAAAGAS